MIKIINNVLNLEDCFSLYNTLVNSNMWMLNRSSAGGASRSFPGVTFIEEVDVIYNDQYWIGYFYCLFNRINSELKKQHNFSLVINIKRIALNATNDNYYTEFHEDKSGPLNTYSIIGFITPQWAEDWGGELNVEGELIKYKPGDFILFDSFKLHKSQPIKKIPYWRMSTSYVVAKSNT